MKILITAATGTPNYRPLQAEPGLLHLPASLGPAAAPAAPALRAAAEGDEADAVRGAAQRALERVGEQKQGE